MDINDGISGIGSRAHIPPIADATHRQDIGGKSRINPGTWTPFLDWDDIYPGNRGRTKTNTYELYDAPLGVSLEIEEGNVSEPILQEDNVSFLPSGIWKKDGKFHFLYEKWNITEKEGWLPSYVCYANSEDGYNWNFPDLKQVTDEPQPNNFLKVLRPGGPGFFEDTNTKNENERFKFMKQEGGGFDPDTGEELTDEEWQKRLKAQDYAGEFYDGPRMQFKHWITAFTSPDGIHWKCHEKPVANFPADGGIAPGYDEVTQQYFSYIRPTGVNKRAISLTKTKDFYNWPSGRLVQYPDILDEPDLTLYGGNYFPYPERDDIHCMFVSIYHQIADTCDNQLAVSRDGLYWNRFRDAITPLGPAGSGYEGMNRAWGGRLQILPDGHWGTLLECHSVYHNWNGNIKGYEPFPKKQGGQLRWWRWLPHRLAGITTKTKGEFTITDISRTQKQLHLNYRCEPGGWIEVELLSKIPSRLNVDGPAIKKFTFNDSDRLHGDSLDQVVSWNGNSDLSDTGKAVAIRIRMFQAKIFAYKI